MKRFLPLILPFICLQAVAQRKETDPYNAKGLSFGPELTLPSRTGFKIGAGVSAKAEWPVTDMVSVTGTLGYTRLYYKSSVNVNGTLSPYTVVPVKVGGRFFLDPDLYCDVDAGAAVGTNYDKKKSLALALGLGYVLPIGNHNGLDLSFRFEDWGKDRMRGGVLRAAYRLAW